MSTESRPVLLHINGKKFHLWTNPGPSDFSSMPEWVRFTADRTTLSVYVRDYTCAMPTSMSMYLGLHDPYSSPDFLKGAAPKRADGVFRMVESHFLQSFKRNRLPREGSVILKNLLNQDWSWPDKYVDVAGWLEDYQKAMGI